MTKFWEEKIPKVSTGTKLLRVLFPNGPKKGTRESFYEGNSKVGTLMGPGFFDHIAGKSVTEFGCGEGADAVRMAQAGACVTAIDIRESVLEIARSNAIQKGVQDHCTFITGSPASKADIVVSIDAFEHFADPAGILEAMAEALKPGGEALITFGPPWKHPHGGHAFSMFPWSHLLFTEQSLMGWYRPGLKRFEEMDGGLNAMTIKRFERLVANSPLRLDRIELVPIRKLRYLHCGATREFTTAIVRCNLVKHGGIQVH